MDRKNFIASYLLGHVYANFEKIQNHLINKEDDKALSLVNAEIVFMKNNIEKYFYDDSK